MKHTRYLWLPLCAATLTVLPCPVSGGATGRAHADALVAESNTLVHADLGLAILGVAYERVLTPRLSLRLAGQYNRPWYTDSDTRAAAVEIRPMLFPLGRGPRGLYLSGFARVAFVRAQDNADAPVTGPGWTAGATVGYGLRLPRGWLLRLGAGFQYWAYRLDAEPEDAGLGGPHIALDAMLAIPL